MADCTDILYFQKRERAERELAANATDPRVCGLHLELADRYAAEAAALIRLAPPALRIAS